MGQQNGVLGSTTAKAGKTLPEHTIKKIKEFYSNDSNSRRMPGIKDTVSIIDDGKRVTVQMRLLLLDREELYVSFK